MAGIVCNTRILGSRLTGVQRYLIEILNHISADVDIIASPKKNTGASAHLWEQGILPLQLNGRLLWSPSNSGPIFVKRQVVTVHDMAHYDCTETLHPNYVAWYDFFQPKLLRHAEGLITISNFTRDRMLDRFPDLEGKITVVLNGVDNRFAPQAAGSVSNTVDALGLPSKNYVLTVGSLQQRKNIKRLVAAWSAVQTRLPDDVWLVIAGGRGVGHVYANTDEGKLPPRVHMTGRVPDEHLPALMSGAIAFCYPSYYEGFGLPPLEAMACGTATLTANTTSLPEVVGDAALTVNPYDIEAMAEGIFTLVTNSTVRSDLEARGLQRARSFAWKDTAMQTLNVLKMHQRGN